MILEFCKNMRPAVVSYSTIAKRKVGDGVEK